VPEIGEPCRDVGTIPEEVLFLVPAAGGRRSILIPLMPNWHIWYLVVIV
jgi:hypothetical protein